MSDYIPPELIPNILARLSVEDVLRCTSVCKSWYELITSPSFESSHLILSNQEPRLFVKCTKSKSRIFSYCLHHDNTFDEIAELDPPIHRNALIIESLHGLVCLYDYHKDTIVLWNPSLRKSIILPKYRVLSDSQVSYDHTIGFGFVATSNDYKILKYSYADNNSAEPQAEIYQLSTCSWRDVKLEDSVDIEVESEQAHLNGILYWSAHNSGKVNSTFSNFICSFDLKTEKFGTLMVPSCLRHNIDVWFMPFTFKKSLCLVDYTTSKSCKIWALKEYGIAESWEELFNINTEHHDLTRFLYFGDNGEILFERRCQSSGKRKLVSYDCKNNRVNDNGLLAYRIFFSIYTYVESLVLIKGSNEVKIDEESTNMSKNI